MPETLIPHVWSLEKTGRFAEALELIEQVPADMRFLSTAQTEVSCLLGLERFNDAMKQIRTMESRSPGYVAYRALALCL